MFLACSVQELLYMSRQAVGFLVLTIIVIIAFLKLVFCILDGWGLFLKTLLKRLKEG